ncbi:MAG TPA: helix-turn-helix transcriptional regulator [Thermoanaerobaculia bacterium]|jgi:transcriptional regulator with XRE-family HTH domain|nr:helix-turn-helix transcriptional regulator [Thermoanaerobaculia bacterium]
MPFRDIGKALAILRQQKGLSQAELAFRTGMGRPQVSRYESGRELMKLETLEKILATLSVEPEDFFRFLRSFDPSVRSYLGRVPNRVDDRLLAEAFQSLHTAIEQLRQVIERTVDPATWLSTLIKDDATRRAVTIDKPEP